MSDLSTLDQSFALMPASVMPPMGEPQALYQPPSNDVQPHEVTFRQLRGPQEIARVLHLRDEIALSSAVRGDAAFTTREKKETKSVS